MALSLLWHESCPVYCVFSIWVDAGQFKDHGAG